MPLYYDSTDSKYRSNILASKSTLSNPISELDK